MIYALIVILFVGYLGLVVFVGKLFRRVNELDHADHEHVLMMLNPKALDPKPLETQMAEWIPPGPEHHLGNLPLYDWGYRPKADKKIDPLPPT